MRASVTPAPFAWRAVAWTGGALFVVSLAYGAWFFAIVLGRPATPGSAPVHAGIANVLLYSLFALHHSIMARLPAKRWIERTLPPQLERTFYVWVASVLFLLLCLAWVPVPGTVWRLEGPWRWLAHGAQTVGLALVVLGARALDPLGLAGIRATSMPAATPAPVAATAFSRRGAYGIVRHPIYTGTIALLAAMPDMTAGRLFFAVLTTLYIVLAIPWEEATLVEQHGEAYLDYQRAVRWRVLPGVF